MKNTLITIYITNFNYARFINKAIKSALEQSYNNFEIIIIDDASKDDSKKIIKNYKNYKKISIIYNKKRKGLIKSSNIAIKKSRGHFFLRLDADDYLHPKALETMIRIMNKFPNTALVFSDFYTFNNNSKKFSINSYNEKKKFTLADDPPHGACSLVRKKFFYKVGGYNSKFDRQDGYYLWLALLLNEYKVSHCNKPLFFYRKHNKSLSRNLIKLLRVRLNIINFFSKKNLSFKNLLLNNKKKTNLRIKKLR